MENTDKGIKNLTTKFMLTVRTMVGAYLLYVSYSLLEGIQTEVGFNKYAFVFFVIVFTIAAVVLIVSSLLNLKKGKYIGGAMDAQEKEISGEEKERD